MSALADRLFARLAAVESEVAALAGRFQAARPAWCAVEQRVTALEEGERAGLRDALDGLATREELDALTDTVKVLLLRVELLEQRPSPRRATFTPPDARRRQP